MSSTSMNMTPVYMTLYTTTLLTSQANKTTEGQKYLDRCLTEKINEDIYKKVLQNEQLDEKEAERISNCVQEKKDESERISGPIILLCLVFLVIMIIFTIMSCIFY